MCDLYCAVMETKTATTQSTPSRWTRFVIELTTTRLGITLVAALTITLILNPIFLTPFVELLGRSVFVGMTLLVAFTLAGLWHPVWLPKWVAQMVAVGIAAPLATLAVYVLKVEGDWHAFFGSEARVSGFLFLSGSALFIGLLLALGALYRERDAQARAQALQFALERETLERQAADARLSVLQAQIEPHFLFNTLANIQTLIESGSPRAVPVFKSLIAYLRAAMPKLHQATATLGNEEGLVRSYLELMLMRMPDRLNFQIDIAPELREMRFPAMALLTLVENAVRHGIDPSEEGGTIQVRAWREGDTVLATVVDTGMGMNETASPGTGLANLQQRIVGFYGADASLDLSDNSPSGLCAELRFTMPR
jgi:sensor histidine kinase YesM